jgi:general secretion pathway protein D
MFRVRLIQGFALATTLAGCSGLPQPRGDALLREAVAGTEKKAPRSGASSTPAEALPAPTVSDVSHGSGEYVRPTVLAKPHKQAKGESAVTFNFENQPVEAVVKAILGDLLHENYSIVPGVQGNISFATALPVGNEQALPILETLLSWTGNALVDRGGRYVVMPVKDAAGGNIVPSLGASAPRGGLQARLFPLRFISATEMHKLIKPFARADAVLLVDPTRNLIVLSGTGEEITNYQNTINTFDVDWLRNTSVGVFNLQRTNVKDLLPQLNSLFGPKGDTPLAGMLRFIPIERTNALVVISQQPAYLDEIKGWLERIDRGGGNEPQLYVYDVRNVQASDLAQYLGNIYGDGAGGAVDHGGKVGPGLSADTIASDNKNNGDTGVGSTTGSFGSGKLPDPGAGLAGKSMGAAAPDGSAGHGSAGGASVTTEEGIRITSVDNNNQLLVRARPAQWVELQTAIKRLDSVPLQVQIETRILEVALTGAFSFGVQWYLEGLVGGENGGVGQSGNKQQWALGSGGNKLGAKDAFFYSFANNNLSAAVHALETSGNARILSAPSLVVLNNQQAGIQVGDKIPINSVSFDPNNNTGGTINNTTYLDTGVILNVRPRVNPGGLVYMQINQQVSAAGQPATAGGNPSINQRQITTQVAVQSGQTVLLGGLIKQNEGTTDTGIPGLNRIPMLGRLFGSTSRDRNRTELIVLITPKVISSSDDARAITDEYQEKFESLAPLRMEGGPEAL